MFRPSAYENRKEVWEITYLSQFTTHLKCSSQLLYSWKENFALTLQNGCLHCIITFHRVVKVTSHNLSRPQQRSQSLARPQMSRTPPSPAYRLASGGLGSAHNLVLALAQNCLLTRLETVLK